MVDAAHDGERADYTSDDVPVIASKGIVGAHAQAAGMMGMIHFGSCCNMASPCRSRKIGRVEGLLDGPRDCNSN